MKGNTKTVNKILVLVFAAFIATVCGFVSVLQKRSYAADIPNAVVHSTKNFSQVDQFGNIFSVEKVLVNSSENEYADSHYEDAPYVEEFFSDSSLTNPKEMETAVNGKSYFYEDIPVVSDTAGKISDKTVVYNNEFVMLQNKLSQDGKYYSGNLVDNKQEAILVSFGQYNYEDGMVDSNGQEGDFEIVDKTQDELSSIKITASLNNNPTRVPGNRQFGDGKFQDFVFIIPQQAKNEGYWKFEITYFFAEQQFKQNFEFYLLFNTSYTQVEGEYSAEPSLNEISGDSYYLGYNLQYPTLTYDYTKYGMSYTHTAYGVKTEYEVRYNNGTLVRVNLNNNEELPIELVYYNASKVNNYIVMLFTDVGNYSFNFEYIYGGVYNPENKPDMNLTVNGLKFDIHGYQAMYSKYGYTQAELKHLTLSNSVRGIKADLFVPNGYNSAKATPANSKLGVIYTLVDSEFKAGTVINHENSNVLLSSYNKGYISTTISGNEYAYVYENGLFVLKETTGNVYKRDDKTYDIGALASNIKLTDSLIQPNGLYNQNNKDVVSFLTELKLNNGYVKTNQGSIWLTSTDDYDMNNSFYFFHKSHEITFDDLYYKDEDDKYKSTAKTITNTTEFNKTGYYLVFVNVDTDEDRDGEFYQMFAFQYTTDTINITVKTLDDKKTQEDESKVIGAGKYTNELVKITWNEPGIFDRKVEAFYYYGQTKDSSTLQSYSAKPLQNGDVIGEEVINSDSKTWATYLVQVKSEDKATTTRMFTIDTQDIAGIGVYSVKKDGSVYKFASNSSGNVIQQYEISNSPSTLFWKDKTSGANISVKYSFTPFVKDSTIDLQTVKNENGEEWINTTYKLGISANGLEISKANLSQPRANYVVASNQMFSQQGIYIFTLTDEAGNSCEFMFIIDKTEAYFKITNDGNTIYTTRTSELYANKISYSVGTHKVIDLTVNDYDVIKNKISEYISALANNKLGKDSITANYYVGDASNVGNLHALVDTYSSKIYLKVANSYVKSYNSEGGDDTSKTGLAYISQGSKVEIDHSTQEQTTSTIRKLYIVGENQKYVLTDAKESASYVIVEINKDNSRGMVYSSADKFSSVPSEIEGRVKRIVTGDSSVASAHATSDSYVAFSWKVGAGNFLVEEVSYTYFEFDNTLSTFNNELYFYEANGETFNLFKDGKYQNGATLDGENAYAVINESNGETAPGLYVVTRKYQQSADYGEDKQSRTYYFIVDRTGIIDGAAGSNIEIMLLENETPFSNFEQINANSGEISYNKTIDGTDTNFTYRYYSYLTTNKVPATMLIPVGKYFNGTKSSNYFAGRLTFEIHYNDTKGLFGAPDSYLMFEVTPGKTSELSSNDYIVDGAGNITYYKIDFTAKDGNGKPLYLNAAFQKLLTAWNKAGQTDWMYLEGDYIIIIKDTVESANANMQHQKVIAFTVEQKLPSANIYVTTEKDSTSALDQVYGNKIELVTNQEFVKLEIDAYNSESLQAELDTNWLEITRQYGSNQVQNYVTRGYKDSDFELNSVFNLIKSDIVNVDANGNLTVFLDTALIRGNNIIWNEEPITYTVTVRYRLYADVNLKGETYKECYINPISSQAYYYQEFKVVIDRTPPTTNLNNLISAEQEFVKLYNNKNGIVSSDATDMFENAVYDSGILYFTHRYSAYYSLPEQTKELYALRVNQNTIFKPDDVEKVYYRFVAEYGANSVLSTIALNLPKASSSGYEVYNPSFATNGTYNYNFLNRGKGIYEIIELDKAGNMTQYLVEYCGEKSVTVALSTDTETINLTNGSAVSFTELTGVEFKANDENFFLVKLEKDGNEVVNILTDFTTSIDAVNNAVKNAITGKDGYGFGIYSLTVSTKSGTSTYELNYVDSLDVGDLDLAKLVDNKTWKINLFGADYTTENNSHYYLSSVTISYYDANQNKVSTTYTRKVANGEAYYEYKLNNDESAQAEVIRKNHLIPTQNNVIYTITAYGLDSKAVLAPYRFMSGNAGYVYRGISFGEDGSVASVNKASTYYVFQQANISFDFAAFEKVSIKWGFNNSVNLDAKIYEGNPNIASSTISGHKGYTYAYQNGKGVITLYPYLDKDSGVGAVLYFEVELYQLIGGITPEFTYTVVIDTRTGSVQLKDNASGNLHTLDFDYNNQDITETAYSNYLTGSKILIWDKVENEKFNYVYTLYETMKETDSHGFNVVRTHNLSEENGHFSIFADPESTGEYRFVVTVLNSDGKFLGNKIYTFAVKTELNKIYYVQTLNNHTIEANSTFVMADIDGVEFENGTIPQLNGTIPLYISNEPLKINYVQPDGLTSTVYKATNVPGFEIYEFDAVTYKLFVGILKVEETTNLINNISVVNSETQETLTIWSYGQLQNSNEGTVVVGNNFKVKLESFANTGAGNKILNKNKIVVDIRYLTNLVSSFEIGRGSELVDINGNGSYTFTITDISGNAHSFTTRYASFDYVQATFLSEVEININEMAPINNAYYNGQVDFAVINRGNYEQGTIEWSATLNGSPYHSSKTTYSYSFKESGTYRLVVRANPKGDRETVLEKILVFTIINEKEARKSFDLTNLSGYKIVNVLDNEGEDVTEIFVSMLSLSNRGMLVNYENLLQTEGLNLGSGKQTFTITYCVEQGLYPTRMVTFKFTMNNETPNVECSLKAGSSSTKGFSISYNASIIYSQVGECAIYVNNKLVKKIDENSSNELAKNKFTEKSNGAGDYYITLKSSSGDILLAYKVEIKEPLNASAIIIIVVVSLVVIGVIVTIIVLRTKMRIR